MDPARHALRKPVLVLAAMGVLLICGLMAYVTIPRQEDPDFHVRTCLISTPWPGASALDVERLVTDPLEEAIQTLDDVRTLRSDSKTGLSLIWVDLADEGIQASEVDNVWDQIQKRISDVSEQLPARALRPQLNRDFGKTAALLISIYEEPNTSESGQKANRYTPRELEIFAEQLKDDFKSLEAVARVDLYGTREEAIYVEAEMGHWSQLGITAEDLRRRLEARNILEAGGSIDGDWGRFNIRPTGNLKSVQQINSLIVAEKSVPVYLRDLGLKVSRRYREPADRLARFADTQTAAPCLVLALTMKDGFNVVTLGHLARERLAAAQENLLPPDIKTAILSDAPAQVEREVNAFQANLALAVLLVIAVAFFLIGLRVALVMAAAIPLVIISSIGFMSFFGVSLNNISIAALIVALGLLVDNAVEVCDNAHNFMAKGYSRFEAVARGSAQIAFPVLIATLTTVFAFLPMLTIPGNSGEYIRDLPIVVTLALLISYATAFTFTALMAFWVLRPGHQVSPLQWIWQRIRPKKKETQGSTLKAPPPLFDRFCAIALRYKGLVLGTALAWFIVAASLPATGRVGEEFFAFAHRDQFMVDVRLPTSSTIAETREAVERVEALIQALGKQPGADGSEPPLRNLVSFIGEGGPRFFVSVEPEPPSPQTAVILINTTSPEVVNDYIVRLKRAVLEGLKGEDGAPELLPPVGARVTPRKFVKGPPIKFPVVYRLYGPDAEQLRAHAAQTEKVLAGLPGTWAVENSWGHAGYELAVEVKDEQAGLSGITNHKIAADLNAYFNGRYLTSFREGERKIPVYLRLPRGQASSLKTLDKVYVQGHSGKVPMDAITRITPSFQPGHISRRNQVRCIEVRCRLDPGHLASAIDRKAGPILKALQADWDPAYRVEIGGEPEKSAESQKYMQRSFQISGLLIFLCLMALFHSFWKTAIVLMMVPLAAGGGLYGLYITGLPMGFMAMLGMLSLAGIVINDALVLIEFIEHEIKEALKAKRDLAPSGMRSFAGLTRDGFRKCLITGTRMRVLPILLTTLTTVGGLLPLAFSGGPLWKPLAITVIFGLSITTVLVFFVFPALYASAVEVFKLQPLVVDVVDKVDARVEVAVVAAAPVVVVPPVVVAAPALTAVSTVAKPSKVKVVASDKTTPAPNVGASAKRGTAKSTRKAKTTKSNSKRRRATTSAASQKIENNNKDKKKSEINVKEQKPRLLKPLRPNYPKGIEAPSEPVEVSLMISVDSQGRPVRIKARSSGDRAFAQTTIRAVKAARFTPATKDGQAVDGTVKLRLRFKAKTNPKTQLQKAGV